MGNCAKEPFNEKEEINRRYQIYDVKTLPAVAKIPTLRHVIMKEICKGGGGLWPDCIIRYRFDNEIEIELSYLIETAIDQWNQHNKDYCEFKQEIYFEYPVTFIQNNEKVP